ncbi:uncharacterized protein LOC124263217 isoform X2 [Haliotis rubra]|uniref:uncharacterized protein LOC124263217 isoform X2 n=1 Tax=Haliotis rubra TaxID=36100 RepID=UPI001EE5286D|nr:uncharacterized protein LOC124263217 isoform X2 [Haliotis rubra]
MDRLLQERETSRKRTNTWDGTKTLVFRDVDDARHVTLEQSTEVVDITPNHHALHQICSTGKPEDHQELIRLTWDSVDPRSCLRSSYETVHSDQNLLETIVQCLCENNFSTLRKLCRTFYNAYTTKLTCIKINPLTFTFLHRSGQEEMRHLGPKLASVLKNQLSESLPETDDVKLNLQFCTDDTVSRDYCMQIPGESETEMRFSQMEKQIESLRCMFEEQRIGRTFNSPSLSTGPVFRQYEERDPGNQNHVAGPISSSDGAAEKCAGAAEGKGLTQETLPVTTPVAVTGAPTSVAKFRQVNQMTGITGTCPNIDNTEGSAEVTMVPKHALDPNHTGDKAGVTQPSSLGLSSTGGFGGAPGLSDLKNIKVVERRPSLGEDQPSATTTAGNTKASQQSFNYEGRKTKNSNWMKVNPAPPTAKSMNTILCLDASSSMGPDGFEEMKKIACSFIDGLEDITSEYEIEENVAVVAFGGTPRVVHHLSNDYGSVITAIENIPFGGRSPLFEALKECLQELNDRGSTLSISGVHSIPPRIIIITDGKASNDANVGIDVETIDDNVKLQVIQMMKEFRPSEYRSTLPRPIAWIPAGNANLDFIKSLAKLAGGIYLSGADITHLCKYQMVQITIGKIFVCMQNNIGCSGSGNETDINEILNIFARDLDPEDKEEVINTVKDKLKGKPGVECEGHGPADFDNVIEHDDPVLACLGTRVVRGPDWKWGNQDTDGAGTVINHTNDPRYLYWIWVHWDNGTHNKYRYGRDGAFDVKSVECRPRITESLIDIGCEVQRDWQDEHGDQDGGPGGVGVVIRVKDNGMVKVRWKLTHHINEYKYGYDGKMDLTLRDPVDIVMENTRDDTPGTEASKDPAYPPQTQWMWLWKDEAGHWLSYSEEDEKRLEQAYRKRQNGSCLISINGTQYRVLFKEWQQRRLDDNVRMEVQRRPMDQ